MRDADSRTRTSDTRVAPCETRRRSRRRSWREDRGARECRPWSAGRRSVRRSRQGDPARLMASACVVGSTAGGPGEHLMTQPAVPSKRRRTSHKDSFTTSKHTRSGVPALEPRDQRRRRTRRPRNGHIQTDAHRSRRELRRWYEKKWSPPQDRVVIESFRLRTSERKRTVKTPSGRRRVIHNRGPLRRA